MLKAALNPTRAELEEWLRQHLKELAETYTWIFSEIQLFFFFFKLSFSSNYYTAKEMQKVTGPESVSAQWLLVPDGSLFQVGRKNFEGR